MLAGRLVPKTIYSDCFERRVQQFADSSLRCNHKINVSRSFNLRLRQVHWFSIQLWYREDWLIHTSIAIFSSVPFIPRLPSQLEPIALSTWLLPSLSAVVAWVRHISCTRMRVGQLNSEKATDAKNVASTNVGQIGSQGWFGYHIKLFDAIPSCLLLLDIDFGKLDCL